MCWLARGSIRSALPLAKYLRNLLQSTMIKKNNNNNIEERHDVKTQATLRAPVCVCVCVCVCVLSGWRHEKWLAPVAAMFWYGWFIFMWHFEWVWPYLTDSIQSGPASGFHLFVCLFSFVCTWKFGRKKKVHYEKGYWKPIRVVIIDISRAN